MNNHSYDLCAMAQRILPLLDLTSLNDDDTEIHIRSVCHKALLKQGHVAAVCVYPQFIAIAKEILASTPVRIATVVNFPYGNQSILQVVADIEMALASGADEIDVVIPYRDVLAGEFTTTADLVKACKQACHDNCLKVILETGELKNLHLITEASIFAIQAGADFLKTSTGKMPVNATIEAATAMLNVIHTASHPVGFKASGGIRTTSQAADYLQLADTIMGPNWVSPETFRFGASSLLADIQTHLI